MGEGRGSRYAFKDGRHCVSVSSQKTFCNSIPFLFGPRNDGPNFFFRKFHLRSLKVFRALQMTFKLLTSRHQGTLRPLVSTCPIKKFLQVSAIIWLLLKCCNCNSAADALPNCRALLQTFWMKLTS